MKRDLIGKSCNFCFQTHTVVDVCGDAPQQALSVLYVSLKSFYSSAQPSISYCGVKQALRISGFLTIYELLTPTVYKTI